MASTINTKYGTRATLAVTALSNMASSQTAGWESAIVDNGPGGGTEVALDYEINVKLPMANTAAANDKAVYLYAIPWMWNGSAWVPGADLGTTTAFTGIDAAATRSANGLNAHLALQLNYVTQNMTLSGQFNLADAIATISPDGWSLFLINYTGAAIGASPIIAYRPLHLSIV